MKLKKKTTEIVCMSVEILAESKYLSINQLYYSKKLLNSLTLLLVRI